MGQNIEGAGSRAGVKRSGGRPAHVVAPTSNAEWRGNEIFPASENLLHPRCKEIRQRYGLDAVIAGETDEFQRILLLRHWIRAHIRINNRFPTRTRGDAFGILDAALEGGGFHCAHFMVVQHAVLNSFGYVTRSLGAGPGLNEPAGWGHHGVNEVWVNSLRKWVLVDAKYDLHFERDGVPLSALEVRDEVIRDGARAVRRAYGPERRRAGREGKPDTYRWVSWHLDTASFSSWPLAASSALVIYEDEFFRRNTWYRDGKPHWAYAAGYFLKVGHREWIEWTPNVVDVRVTLRSGCAHFSIRSCTPNLKEYQIKPPGGHWGPVAPNVEQRLSADRHEFLFRAVNLVDVAGPEHRVVLERAPAGEHGG